MLLLIPLAVFLALFLVFLGLPSGSESGPSEWQAAFLEAAAFWGALVVAFSEGLSLFQALDRVGGTVLWGAALLTVVWLGWRRGALREGASRLRRLWVRPSGLQVGLFAVLALLLLGLLAVAWVSPPNNVDSLLYHMSRVVHWAQDASLRHYPTGYAHQLVMPIWAETAILNLRLLWGSDRPANLVQWFSMVGSLVGVSGLAGLMGAGRRGQTLSVAFAASVPMGVLQATSTQNDFVVAFWIVCLAYFVLLSRSRPLTRIEQVSLGLMLGLGMLTKGTFYVYAAPFGVWYFLSRCSKAGLVRAVREAAVVVVLAAVLNAGFWTRNFLTYGGPLGNASWIQSNLNIGLVAPGPLPPAQPGAAGVGQSPPRLLTKAGRVVAELLALEAQMAGRNLITPYGRLNTLLMRGVAKLPGLFGPDFPVTMAWSAWNHEDTAGNPLHLAIFFVSLIILAWRHLRGRPGEVTAYAGLALASYALLPIVLGNGASVDGLRFQLPFFVLAAPVAGIAFSPTRWPWLAPLAAAGLLVAAFPWLLLNNTRPVIGHPPWPTRTESVFTTSPEKLLFAINPTQRVPTAAAIQAVKASGCKAVGLRLDSHDLEYQLWWMMEAPQSGIRMETLYTFPALKRYLDPQFKPCAILCTICGDRQRLNGLNKAGEFGSLLLFAGDGFVPDENG